MHSVLVLGVAAAVALSLTLIWRYFFDNLESKRFQRVVHKTMQDHRDDVSRVAARVAARPNQSRLSLQRRGGQSNTIRNEPHKKRPDYFGVDVSMLNAVIEVDPVAQVAFVEPSVPFDDLVAATLAAGMLPEVAVEFPGITVGGALSGAALESSSFRHGQFFDTVVQAEVVLASGEVVVADRDGEYADLFAGLSGSYGSFGIVTGVWLRLEEAPAYVSLTYHHCASAFEAVELMGRLTSADSHVHDGRPPPDFVEGVVLASDWAVVVAGRKSVERTTSRLLRFSRHWDKWYYLHLRDTAMAGRTGPDDVPIWDFIFRYDNGAFWTAGYVLDMFPGGNNVVSRFLLGGALNTRHLFDVTHAADLAELGRLRVIQDIYIPIEAAGAYVEMVKNELGVYPLWLCPVRAADSRQFMSPSHVADSFSVGGRRLRLRTSSGTEPKAAAGGGGGDDQMFVNVGIYGRPREYPFDVKALNERLMNRAHAVGGRKMLYAQTWYSEDEFWQVYDRDAYDALRRKYGADEAFYNIYQKVSLTDEERAVLQTPLGRSEKAHLALVIAKIIGHKIGTWF